MIDRILENRLFEELQSGNKIIILYGSRQVGKTTLISRVIHHGYEFKWNPKQFRLKYEPWHSAYPDASYSCITPEQIGDFLLAKSDTDNTIS